LLLTAAHKQVLEENNKDRSFAATFHFCAGHGAFPRKRIS